MFRKDDVLLVSLEIPIETAVRALRRGFDAGMCTILNPAPAPALSGPDIHISCFPRPESSRRTMAKPWRSRAWPISRSPEPDLDACGSRLQALGPAAVVITLGSRGCQVIASETWSVAAPRVEAIDTVGAGDAFNGCGGCRGGRVRKGFMEGSHHENGRLGQRGRGACRYPARCAVGFAVSRSHR